MNNDCFEYCGGKAINLFLILTLLQKYALQKFKIHIFLISSTFSKELAFLVNCGTLSYVLILFSASTELDDPRFVFVETMHVLKCVFFFKKLHTLLGGHLNDA